MKRNFFKFTTYFLMLAIFSISVVETGAQSNKNIKKNLKKAKGFADDARRSFDKKDYKTAIDKYTEAITLAPNNAEMHFWKGKAYYELKQFDQSIGEFNLALSQGYDPSLEVYKLRLKANLEMKNYDAVLDDAIKVLQSEPSDLSLNQTVGELYLGKNSYNEAIPVFQKILQLDPNNAEAYYYLALAYHKLGDYKNQQINALEAIKRNTKFTGESYFIIGDAAQKSKNYNEAIEAYRKTLSAKPDNYQVYQKLPDIFRVQNRFAEAIEVAKKGTTIYPNDANLLVDLSRYYSLADQSALSISAAQQAVRLMPDKVVSHSSLCRAYYEDKQFESALQTCNTALKLNPNDGEANVYLGFTYLSLDQVEKANEYFARAVNGLKEYTEKNPNYADGFHLLGNVYYYVKQPKNAIEAYSRSLQLYPQFAKARFNLGLAYFVNGNTTAAHEQYNALLKQDKDLAAMLKQTLDKTSEKIKK
jgi:tetratricopeptide (TPR) repeat protein